MATGLSGVLARVERAARRAGRDPRSVRLVGVGKSGDIATLRSAYDEGLRDFGENRVDVLVERAAALPDDVRWHMVGRLQGNKVRRVRPVTHLLHSLDRHDLAGYWVKGPGLPPPALVQVNVGGEEQKAGVAPADAGDLVAHSIGLGIEVVGLMTVPPAVEDPELVRPYFAALRTLRGELQSRFPGLVELSMGMTDDFEVAVEEGATILRVGRAIFRPTEGED